MPQQGLMIWLVKTLQIAGRLVGGGIDARGGCAAREVPPSWLELWGGTYRHVVRERDYVWGGVRVVGLCGRAHAATYLWGWGGYPASRLLQLGARRDAGRGRSGTATGVCLCDTRLCRLW